jgi:hypothetical protein
MSPGHRRIPTEGNRTRGSTTDHQLARAGTRHDLEGSVGLAEVEHAVSGTKRLDHRLQLRAGQEGPSARWGAHETLAEAARGGTHVDMQELTGERIGRGPIALTVAHT